MKELTEGLFQYNWKSYKTFASSGKVRRHTITDYQEFDFGFNKSLTIIEYSKNTFDKIKEVRKWSIGVEKNKHLLHIEFTKGKIVYEIISINHTDMVLREFVTQDKVFFAKTDAWRTLVTL